MNRQTKDLEGDRSPAEAAEKFRRLAEGWMAEDPAYGREAWPELKRGLDRNRRQARRYRKHFPEDGSEAGRRQACPGQRIADR